MQKALLLALIFGAFLFSPVSKSEIFYICPTGSTYEFLDDIHACTIPVGQGERYKVTIVTNSGPKFYYGSSYHEAAESGLAIHNVEIVRDKNTENSAYKKTVVVTFDGVKHHLTYSSWEYTRYDSFSCGSGNAGCTPPKDNAPSTTAMNASWSGKEAQEYCPPDDAPETGFGAMYERSDGTKVCFKPAIDCPELNGDCEEEPPCDDLLGNCTEPDPFECFLTTSGSEVCFADPNEKCDVESVNGEPVFSNCSAGCGFVNDNFVCADEPDLPNLDDCLVTTNGYACPTDTPPPNDDIDDPTKPLPDMQKHDFKDVLKGVETRLNNTNKLINDQIARDRDNTNKLAGKLDVGNKALKGIEDNTGSAAKSLREGLYGDALEIDDGTGSLLSDLGLTGDESITDLEKGTVSLSDYRDQFTWSAGSSTCPSPRSMNILHKTFSIDWQPYCDAFGVLGYFIKAAALFLSGFIAFGVRK